MSDPVYQPCLNPSTQTQAAGRQLGVMLPQAEECLGPPESGRGMEESSLTGLTVNVALPRCRFQTYSFQNHETVFLLVLATSFVGLGYGSRRRLI